jgi:MFS family permease
VLLAMHVRAGRPALAHTISPFEQFKEGWAYAYGFRPIRSIIALIALVCLVGAPYTVLMPIFAGIILHGGPHTLGFLMTASGGGALLGALWLASRRSIVGLSHTIPVAAGLFGVGLMAFSISRVLWLSLAMMVVTGFGFMVQVASSNTLLQTIVEDAKRGRVIAFFLMAYLGTTPFGSLMAGALSARVGAAFTLAIGGICCVGGALWFAAGLSSLHEDIHPVYVELGIVPGAFNEIGRP